ncbi:acyltransferase-domain-containing protein [Moesziomyces antarcticus]|nr:acyltransferase-domain-containing protein [Moesziomyces antarcticus]GAK61966.1 acyltransferase-domain-containing protein [Moesziomyces antarcticus]
MVLATARALKPFSAAAAASTARAAAASTISTAAMAPMPSSSSTYTIRAVAAFARNLLRFGCRNVTVRGLDRFLAQLHSAERTASSRGLLTYCNHISVLDEPTIWGTLPASTFRDPRTVRWTLGASDIMFTKPMLARFFRNGQCIETHRGGGIYQKAIDEAISKLNTANWVHLFPEGYVNVSTSSRLRRFKWGIARMLLEAERLPTVVPIWITGFDRMMPEPRAKPKWLPRFGNDVSITFGEPVTDQLAPVVEAIRATNDIAPQHLLPEELRFDPASIKHADPDAVIADRSVPTQLATEWNTASLFQRPLRAGDDSRLALARSQLAALLRYHLGLVAVQQRTADAYPNPQEDATLVHTESLNPQKQHAQNNVLRDGQRKKTGV